MAEREGRRWSVLPRLVAQAPPRALIVVGGIVTVLGILIISRPLASLLLLGVYVGVSAVASGVIELLSAHRSPAWWNRAFAIVWIAVGLVVLIWLGASLNILPTVLAVLLLLGGVASIGDAVVPRRSGERVRVAARLLGAVWGGSQVVFGILSLTWPDVTVLVVAVVFGVRTLVFGATLLFRGIAALRARPDRGGRSLRARAPRPGLADAGRYALAVLLVVVTAGGWFLNGWLAGGAPVVDAFYDPPATLPSGHGELIRSDAYGGTIPAGATVTRILYTTTDAHGQPVAASALVILPDVDIQLTPHPVILWNHGTTGVARGCAPSLTDTAATRWAIPALDEAISRGWMVVAPDYTGQGAPGVFPYLIGQGEARSALDAVEAAGRLPQVWASDEVVVWGHSQGGHAALWASRIAAKYTPDLTVLGTAALAPAGDPLALARDLTAGFASPQLTVLTAWVLSPYSETYPDVRIQDYVSPGTRAIVHELAQRCPTEPGLMVSVLAALGISERQTLYLGDLTAGTLGRRLGENAAMGTWTSPLLIMWGQNDDVIPRSQQVAYVDRLCKADNSVEWVEYPVTGHQDILQPGSQALPKLMDWTAGLFVHRDPPASRCA
ncbi:alpha/beta fold hydrolase [Microbacterium protaetiae]|uniref:Alpha/beta fold hydrolase n=1 Tax=Microbacterium protaetiae TaxID=2509458 RepID=A0A4P6EGZ1_9MICO|nr:lipase family protein [Microbacterium protaetiae]QAY60743.1 alpha/beta fold hydrolase [Microbacterium protaetiae]